MITAPIFDGTTSVLNGEVGRFLRRAYSKGPEQNNRLWQHYLRPHLRDIDGGTYVPLLPRDDYRGRRPEHVDGLLRNETPDAVIQENSPYFINSLRDPKRDHRYGEYWDRTPKYEPSRDRLTNIGFLVYTIEFDLNLVSALEQQISWCIGSRGTRKGSILWTIEKELARYRDYRGVTAVYSGGKSVHFHFVFDTRHLKRSLCEGDRRSLEKWQGDVPDVALADLYRYCPGVSARLCPGGEVPVTVYVPSAFIRVENI